MLPVDGVVGVDLAGPDVAEPNVVGVVGADVVGADAAEPAGVLVGAWPAEGCCSVTSALSRGAYTALYECDIDAGV